MEMRELTDISVKIAQHLKGHPIWTEERTSEWPRRVIVIVLNEYLRIRQSPRFIYYEPTGDMKLLPMDAEGNLLVEDREAREVIDKLDERITNIGEIQDDQINKIGIIESVLDVLLRKMFGK